MMMKVLVWLIRQREVRDLIVIVVAELLGGRPRRRRRR
jgi:hypothetical protein